MNNLNPEFKDIFLGNLKQKETKTRAQILSGIVYLDNIDNVPAEHIQTDKNQKRFIKVIVISKRTLDAIGNTHTIKVDTYKHEAHH